MPLQRCIQALRTFLLWRSEGVGNADSQALVRQLVRVQALRAPPALLGRAGGGACCRLQCSTPLAARPWEHRGWSPKAPLGASLPWTTCWRSLSQLARAASRCAKRGPCPSRWATPSSPDSAQPHVFQKKYLFRSRTKHGKTWPSVQHIIFLRKTCNTLMATAKKTVKRIASSKSNHVRALYASSQYKHTAQGMENS